MKNRRIIKLTALAAIGILLMALVACGPKESTSIPNAFDGRSESVVIGYYSMEEYSKDIMLRDTTVKEVAEKMDNGETFVVFASFENCPWCNLLIPYLNDAAIEAGVTVGYIDTRANPEWTNNMEIDDYDLFVEKFGKYLKDDADGKPHLYTPDTYFIKNGKIVSQHVGVTPGVENPSDPLTSEQEEKLRKDLANEFSKLN